MDGRKARLLTLWVLASTLAAFDLWVNVFVSTPEWAYHQRSLLWAGGCLALLVAVVPLTRLPSATVTVGAGVLSGGVLGNLISGASDHLAVPNPLFLTAGKGGIAFNLADTFILCGNLILVVALCMLVLRHREQLRGPAAVVRTLRGAPRGDA